MIHLYTLFYAYFALLQPMLCHNHFKYIIRVVHAITYFWLNWCFVWLNSRALSCTGNSLSSHFTCCSCLFVRSYYRYFITCRFIAFNLNDISDGRIVTGYRFVTNCISTCPEDLDLWNDMTKIYMHLCATKNWHQIPVYENINISALTKEIAMIHVIQ